MRAPMFRPRCPARWAAAMAVVGAPAVGGLHSQTPGPGEPRAADLVYVEFHAVGRDGRPVPDLRADEVTLRVGARVRPLRSFEWVRLADPPAVRPGSGDAVDEPAIVPLPYGSNLISPLGRTFLIVLDDDSLRPGREGPLRSAIDGFVAHLTERDRLSLVTVPYGGIKVDFTADHERLRQAIQRTTGQAPQEESGRELACRTRRTLESLTGLLESVSAGTGPTIVVFLSSALAPPRRDAPPTKAPGPCEITTEHYELVGRAAGAARAQFYVVLLDAVMLRPEAVRPESIAGAGFTGSDNPLEGLEHLAGVTGGIQLNLIMAAETALDRVARETSGFYRAAFAPDQSDPRGASQRLDVRVARDGVVVRSRAELVIPRSDGGVTRPIRTSPREMLRTTRRFTDLPLRAAAYASQGERTGTVKVVALAETLDPAATIVSAAAALFDAKGRLAGQWTAGPEDLFKRPLLAAFAVEPGVYRLRVAAIDDAGRSGAADYDVAAELIEAGPLRLSALALGLLRNGFVPRLEFGSEPVAIGYLEIYGAAPGTRVAASLELAASARTPPTVTVPLVLQPAGDRYLATGAIPIGGLPPGDYVIRAVIGLEGQPAGHVMRILRKR